MIYVCPKCDHRRHDPFPRNHGIPICGGRCLEKVMGTLPLMDIVHDEVYDKPYDTSDRPEPEPPAAPVVKKRPGRPKGAKDTGPRRRKKMKPAAQVVRKAGVKKKPQ